MKSFFSKIHKKITWYLFTDRAFEEMRKEVVKSEKLFKTLGSNSDQQPCYKKALMDLIEGNQTVIQSMLSSGMNESWEYEELIDSTDRAIMILSGKHQEEPEKQAKIS